MYERFTDRARKVMQLANSEAQRFNHEYIGTEHILLGLLKEGSGVAAHVLKNLDLDLYSIRGDVESVMTAGSHVEVPGNKLPQAQPAAQVITSAMAEARNLRHNYVGTEHILLGLICAEQGIAAQVLKSRGLSLEQVRIGVQHLLGHGDKSATSSLSVEDLKWELKALLIHLKAKLASMQLSDELKREVPALLKAEIDELFGIDQSESTA